MFSSLYTFMTCQLYLLVALFLWLHRQGGLTLQPLAKYLNFSPLDTPGGFSLSQTG